MQLPKGKGEASHYEPFSDDDLKKLFGSTEYRDQSFAKASEFWIPLLGLYTGARINELAQLHMINRRPESTDPHQAYTRLRKRTFDLALGFSIIG